MSISPVVDPSWHRLPEDAFGAGPSSLTPLDPSGTLDGDGDSDAGSDWSYTDDESLLVLDLGAERIAKRAILGYSVGVELDSSSTSTAARGVRGFRSTTGAAAGGRGGGDRERPARSSANPHLAAGKPLSLTGLNTASPLLKIGETVLKGTTMQTFGSEIVLLDTFDPTQPNPSQHRLQPLPPSTRDAKPDSQSATTRNRIVFRPIYDPKSRQVDNADAYAKLKAIAKPSATQQSEARPREAIHQLSAASLAGAQTEVEEPPVGKGKYKRKEVPEEEQMIRDAERKIRRAAKQRAKQREQELQHDQAAANQGST